MLLNKKVKLEGSRRERIILALKMAGWYEGRSIDISDSETHFKKCGIQLLESGKKFLKEFRGLAEKWYITRNYSENIGEDFSFYTEPYYNLTKKGHTADNIKHHMYRDANCKIPTEDFINIQKVTHESFVYIASIGYYYPADVWIGESGKLYTTHEYDFEVHTFNSIVDLIEWELEKEVFDYIYICKSLIDQ